MIPGINAVGIKTADRTSAMPTTGAEISSIAFSAASFGARPSSMWRSTASTTTMASSTTRPMASTRARSDIVLREKPKTGKNTNVPIRATGTASIGISVARQPCKKIKTTTATSRIATSRVITISFIPAVTAFVVSSDTT